MKLLESHHDNPGINYALTEAEEAAASEICISPAALPCLMMTGLLPTLSSRISAHREHRSHGIKMP